MLASISPVGEQGRGQRWIVTIGAYTVGSAAGGAAVGAVLGLAGAPLARLLTAQGAVVLLGLAAVLGVVLELARPRSTRGWRRQVDERWLTTYRGWVYGLGYGFQLGAAIATVVPTTLTYVVLVAALLSGGPSAGLLVGATFGLVRALPLTATAPVRSPAALRRFHRGLDRARRPVTLATRLCQVALGATALVVAA